MGLPCARKPTEHRAHGPIKTTNIKKKEPKYSALGVREGEYAHEWKNILVPQQSLQRSRKAVMEKPVHS